MFFPHIITLLALLSSTYASFASEDISHIKYFSYYPSEYLDKRHEEVKDHTKTFILVYGMGNNPAFAQEMLPKLEASGMKAIIKHPMWFYEYLEKAGSCVFKNYEGQAWKEEWEKYILPLKQNEKTILGFYLIDEINWIARQGFNCNTEQVFKMLQHMTDTIKGSFPDKPIMLVEAYPVIRDDWGFRVPEKIDWVGFDCYDGFNNCGGGPSIPEYYERIKKVLYPHQRLIAVPPAFIRNHTSHQPTSNDDKAVESIVDQYIEYVAKEKRFIAVFPFTSGDKPWDEGPLRLHPLNTGLLPATAEKLKSWALAILNGRIEQNEPDTYTISYGIDGKLVSKTYKKGDEVKCGNETFGDPAVGVQKACYYNDNGALKKAAEEHYKFIVGGTGAPVYYGQTGPGNSSGGAAGVDSAGATESDEIVVAFGANGQYETKTFKKGDKVRCDIETFGDPVLGRPKVCYDLKSKLPFAKENTTFILGSNEAPVAHVFYVKYQTEPGEAYLRQRFDPGAIVSCTNEFFKADPATGKKKGCFDDYGTKWASEGEKFRLPGGGEPAGVITENTTEESPDNKSQTSSPSGPTVTCGAFIATDPNGPSAVCSVTNGSSRGVNYNHLHSSSDPSIVESGVSSIGANYSAGQTITPRVFGRCKSSGSATVTFTAINNENGADKKSTTFTVSCP